MPLDPVGLLRRYVLIPGFEAGLRRRKTFAYWRELDRSQWLPAQEVDALQLRALRGLLEHAQARCPYYRERWRALGLEARELTDLGSVRRWPVIDRETVRENRPAMRAEGTSLRLITKSTGGSSGVPLQFDLDAGSYERRMAATFRSYAWAGAGPGTKQLYLWGTSLAEEPGWARWKTALYDRLYRREVLSAFALGEATLPRFVERLAARRPDVIVAYTNPLYSFARMASERGLKPFSPRSIVVGAEKLHPFQRTLIEEVFRAPVFETYGSREFMLMGAECECHSGLHLTAEQLLVEVVDENGRPVPPGTEGQLVVTDLYNYGMPFVRYANGDRAIAGERTCPCGRGLPLLAKVTGRQLDILTTPDGRRIGGELFPHLLKDFASVRRFQVVQEKLDEIVLRLVLAPDGEEDLPRIESAARSVLGPSVRLGIERCEDIPLTPAGKLQVVVNRMGADRQSAAATRP